MTKAKSNSVSPKIIALIFASALVLAVSSSVFYFVYVARDQRDVIAGMAVIALFVLVSLIVAFVAFRDQLSQLSRRILYLIFGSLATIIGFASLAFGAYELLTGNGPIQSGGAHFRPIAPIAPIAIFAVGVYWLRQGILPGTNVPAPKSTRSRVTVLDDRDD